MNSRSLITRVTCISHTCREGRGTIQGIPFGVPGQFGAGCSRGESRYLVDRRQGYDYQGYCRDRTLQPGRVPHGTDVNEIRIMMKELTGERKKERHATVVREEE